MEKLKMHTPDRAAEQVRRIAELLPNCVTEAAGTDGTVRKAIDFDQLRQELSDHIVEGPAERYRLDWPGKREAILAANSPIAKTLRPCRDESVDFDTTKNLFIEGDNLDALKLLQETYLGKVKLIYIDPPYNTGSDLIYRDDFAEDAQTYLLRSNQKDESGNRLVANSDTNGSYHSDWLCSVYPRIKHCRSLLTDDGVFLASINDIEFQNLKSVCDEVFGFQNRLATFVWVNEGNIDNQSKIKTNHEYVIAYARNERAFIAPPVIDPNIPETSKLFKDFIENTIVKNGPANPVSDIELPPGFPANFEEGIIEPKENFWPKLSCPVTVRSGVTQNAVTLTSGWSSKDLALEFISRGFQAVADAKGQESRFLLSNTGALYVRKVRSQSQSHVLSVLKGMGTVQEASAELATVGIDFSYPKPVGLIEYLIRMGSQDGDIVLDLYAGSGTTGEAVFRQAVKGVKRRFILVQVSEDAGLATTEDTGPLEIADIAKKRLRNVGANVNGTNAQPITETDLGFRVLKIDTSNMRDVYYTPDQIQQADLHGHIDNIKPDRTAEDLLFQVLLDWGVDLASPIATETINGKTVYFVDGNVLVACFDEGVNDELVKQIAERKPLRTVFRDSSYGSDSVKINIEQIFKFYSPETEVRAI